MSACVGACVHECVSSALIVILLISIFMKYYDFCHFVKVAGCFYPTFAYSWGLELILFLSTSDAFHLRLLVPL